MPELPEVETVRTGLEPVLTGRVISAVTLRRGDLRTPFPKNFAENLTGRRILEVKRRAKYLLIGLDNSQILVIHLGMSGTLVIHDALPNRFETHDHVILRLDNGKALIFNDARRFGLMTLVSSTQQDAHELFAHLGPEPLGKAFTPEYLHQAFQSRKGPVKPVIMDQTLVVGVGNIYASESLFSSGIIPTRAANTITKPEAKKLHAAIGNVLNAAIASGGSTLRDYVRSSGDMGYFQHHFNVYDREGEACITCKTPISSLKQAGRSTFYCKKCQK